MALWIRLLASNCLVYTIRIHYGTHGENVLLISSAEYAGMSYLRQNYAKTHHISPYFLHLVEFRGFAAPGRYHRDQLKFQTSCLLQLTELW